MMVGTIEQLHPEEHSEIRKIMQNFRELCEHFAKVEFDYYIDEEISDECDVYIRLCLRSDNLKDLEIVGGVTKHIIMHHEFEELDFDIYNGAIDNYFRRLKFLGFVDPATIEVEGEITDPEELKRMKLKSDQDYQKYLENRVESDSEVTVHDIEVEPFDWNSFDPNFYKILTVKVPMRASLDN